MTSCYTSNKAQIKPSASPKVPVCPGVCLSMLMARPLLSMTCTSLPAFLSLECRKPWASAWNTLHRTDTMSASWAQLKCQLHRKPCEPAPPWSLYTFAVFFSLSLFLALIFLHVYPSPLPSVSSTWTGLGLSCSGMHPLSLSCHRSQ